MCGLEGQAPLGCGGDVCSAVRHLDFTLGSQDQSGLGRVARSEMHSKTGTC